jgi:hypothetical protein
LRGPAEELSEVERLRLWVGAEHAVRRAHADISDASSDPTDAAARPRHRPPLRPPPRCSVRSAGSWNGNAVGRCTRPRRTTAGRRASCTDAPCPATVRSRSARSAAGALLSARLVKGTETRQLLALLARLTALSESLARLRDTQGRAAQALAARRAAEHLASEYQRRAQAASAAVSRAVSTASTRVPPSVVLPPPYRTTGGPASRGPSATR